MKTTANCLFLLFALMLFGTGQSWGRPWTDTKGRTINAAFVSQTDTDLTVRLTANSKEITIPKERLSEADLKHLELLKSNKAARYFSVNSSERSPSPWYFVVEADTLFSPPVDSGGQWVKDTGRSGIKPPPIDLPVLIEKGVQRFINPQSRKRLVILGAEDFELLEKTSQLELFKKLRLQEKRSLMAVLSANKLEHGKASREAVRKLLEESEFLAANARTQSELFLKRVEQSSPNLKRNFEMTSFQETEMKRWRKKAKYTAFQIEKSEVAWENEIRVKGAGSVTVFSLRENDEQGLEVIAKALSCLPPEMVDYLKVISLHYKGEGFWWGGGSQIYYVLPKDLEFNGALVYVMAHEVGHCIQAQKVKGDWNEALKNCIVFPSAYGLTNVQEDFAEFAAIVTRAWTNPQEMIEIEEVFPWRHAIYTRALGYKRSKSKTASAILPKSLMNSPSYRPLNPNEKLLPVFSGTQHSLFNLAITEREHFSHPYFILQSEVAWMKPETRSLLPRKLSPFR